MCRTHNICNFGVFIAHKDRPYYVDENNFDIMRDWLACHDKGYEPAEKYGEFFDGNDLIVYNFSVMEIR